MVRTGALWSSARFFSLAVCRQSQWQWHRHLLSHSLSVCSILNLQFQHLLLNVINFLSDQQNPTSETRCSLSLEQLLSECEPARLLVCLLTEWAAASTPGLCLGLEKWAKEKLRPTSLYFFVLIFKPLKQNLSLLDKSRESSFTGLQSTVGCFSKTSRKKLSPKAVGTFKSF